MRASQRIISYSSFIDFAKLVISTMKPAMQRGGSPSCLQ